jgi:hypothetical protein
MKPEVKDELISTLQRSQVQLEKFIIITSYQEEEFKKVVSRQLLEIGVELYRLQWVLMAYPTIPNI